MSISRLRLVPETGSYRLYLLPGRCTSAFQSVDFHNHVYTYWKEFWRGEFARNNTLSQPDANIFYRQDVVAVITCEDRVVGTLFCTENNLRSEVTSDISYFARPCIVEAVRGLRARGIHRIATYEMLTVSPDFRKRNTGISFGMILLGIVVNAFQGFDADVMIGPVRLDNGVDQMVAEFGWELISDRFEMHGTPVAVSALFREKTKYCSDPEIISWIDRLWNSRIDLRDGKEKRIPGIAA